MYRRRYKSRACRGEEVSALYLMLHHRAVLLCKSMCRCIGVDVPVRSFVVAMDDIAQGWHWLDWLDHQPMQSSLGGSFYTIFKTHM